MNAIFLSAAWLIPVVAYLLGSIPFGLLIVKAQGGPDIRAIGSGNIGAANVTRHAGKFAGILTLLFDAGKGYLAVWLAFAAAATTLQWALDEAGLLSETMAFGNIVLAGSVLVAAGVYQWTPLKEACLRHCRSPLDFLLFHWRDGALGAVGSGVGHGFFCLGCCWMLMALLFVGGIMNLAWIAGIALLVLIEKTLPWGGRISRLTGAVLVVWGAVTLAAAA